MLPSDFTTLADFRAEVQRRREAGHKLYSFGHYHLEPNSLDGSAGFFDATTDERGIYVPHYTPEEVTDFDTFAVDLARRRDAGHLVFGTFDPHRDCRWITDRTNSLRFTDETEGVTRFLRLGSLGTAKLKEILGA